MTHLDLEPPYTAVVFTSLRHGPLADSEPDDGYAATAEQMVTLARRQPGFLGLDSARSPDGLGVTVSYWEDEESARGWKQVQEHLVAQHRGRSRWYVDYHVHVATVDRAYPM